MITEENENPDEFEKTKKMLNKTVKQIGIQEVPESFVKEYMKLSKIPKEEFKKEVEIGHERWKELSREILYYFKCRACGKCCKIPVMISKEEIEKICEKLKMDTFEFSRRYLGNEFYLKEPCPFLENRKGGKAFCRIYEVRPEVCRLFPFSSMNNNLQAVDECLLAKEISEAIIEFEKKISMTKMTKEEEDLLCFKQDMINKTISLQLPENKNGKEENLCRVMALSMPLLEGFAKDLKDKNMQ